VQKGAGTLSSRNGATVIPADDLIGFAGRWKTRKKLQNVSTGRFSPPGISFARLMLELVSCARGQYSRSFKQSDDFRDFRQLSVSIEANEREWDNAIETTRTWLRDHPERLNDDEQPEEGPS
jgi:hypothetical protein